MSGNVAEMATRSPRGTTRTTTPFGNYENPRDTVTWSKRTAIIKDFKTGNIIFEQKDVEAPVNWSDEAVNVTASKFFFGLQGTPERETSVWQLVHRVARTIADWGYEGGYFETRQRVDEYYGELAWLLLHQRAAFNSPVWFNVGLHQQYGSKSGGGSVGYRFDPVLGETAQVDPVVHPQASACFILGLEDSIQSIFSASRDCASLFKFGSGAGMDLSPLRSKFENLSGGGKASGPVSFGRVIDCTGGTIKSGGRTRRAAIMMTLKDSHPDFLDFIDLKSNEEKKAKALIAAGYPSDFNGEAYGTVGFQNANLSVRISDAFMSAASQGGEWQTHWVTDPQKKGPKFSAREALKKVAKGTWECGDPGVQFDDTIQKWHTCPNSGRINSSNPCSEFLYLDNTSCNLASLRLTQFLDEYGNVLVEEYRRACRIMLWAQEILVGNASYPTARIAENSYRFRPLGLGYADLGAALMVKGLPYDSDEGRAFCGAMTALMTGEAYLASAAIAEKLGAFDGFEVNREPMMRVMRMHRAAVSDISEACPEYLLAAVRSTWDAVLEDGEAYGFRNAQATVLAPTGTISFLMDCATTGIEPELGLVKYKTLAGGGNMKIANPLVEKALIRLGYDRTARQAVLAYIAEKGGVEGCPQLKEEHLPVFDTSFGQAGGKRTLSWKSHVGMMAAAQPFVSGAISKTVNLLETITEDEIYNALMGAWRDGLKAVALYRDNSKWSQPLSNKKESKEEAGKGPSFGSRRKLPKERPALTHHFSVGGHDGYITVGMYDDGSPGEVFIKMNKEGSTVSGLMDTIGILVSIGLQSGVPLETLVTKLSYLDFEPRGLTGNINIPTAKSVVDYVFRYLGDKFLVKPESVEQQHLDGSTSSISRSTSQDKIVTGPPCGMCGSMTVRTGPCFTCRSCSHSTGGCG